MEKITIHHDVYDYSSDAAEQLDSIVKSIDTMREVLESQTISECENASSILYDANELLWKAKVELEKVQSNYERD